MKPIKNQKNNKFQQGNRWQCHNYPDVIIIIIFLNLKKIKKIQ